MKTIVAPLGCSHAFGMPQPQGAQLSGSSRLNLITYVHETSMCKSQLCTCHVIVCVVLCYTAMIVCSIHTYIIVYTDTGIYVISFKLVMVSMLYCLSACLSSVDAQCHDIDSEDQRALIIGQEVCFQCPLTGRTFSWTFLNTPILPVGAEGFANGTLVINSVAQNHLDPAFFRCVADGVQSDPYRLVEACELHARIFPSSVLAFHFKASPGNT